MPCSVGTGTAGALCQAQAQPELRAWWAQAQLCARVPLLSAAPWAAEARLPTAGPHNLAQEVRPSGSQSPAVFFFTHQGLGNDFGNLSEGDTVSSPLLLWERNLLNTNLKDKSGYCACAVTAFPRNLNGILLLFFLITYLNTYLQNSGFSLLRGEGRH